MFGLLGVVESESRMCIYPGRAEKGEELNMSSGEHGILMTSPGQVLFACIFPKSGRRGGASWCVTVSFKPVRPVLAPRLEDRAETEKVVCLRPRYHK